MEQEHHTLYECLVKHFNLEEVKELIFFLDVEQHFAAAFPKKELILELVQYLQRRGRLNELIRLIAKKRPDLNGCLNGQKYESDLPRDLPVPATAVNKRSKRKRKSYSDEFKQKMVVLAESSDKSMAQIEAENGISRSLISKWKKRFGSDHHSNGAKAGEQVPFPPNEKVLKAKINHLEEEKRVLARALQIVIQSSAISPTPPSE